VYKLAMLNSDKYEVIL